MDFNFLINQISKTDVFFKGFVAKSVDKFLSLRNWLIGYYIVEYEQKGADRASYGDNLVVELAENLDIKGLSTTNLKLLRQFYLAYPEISQTASDQLIKIPESNISEINPSRVLNSGRVEIIKQ